MTAGTTWSTTSVDWATLSLGPLKRGSEAHTATASPARQTRRGRSGPGAGGGAPRSGRDFADACLEAACLEDDEGFEDGVADDLGDDGVPGPFAT